MTTVPTGTVTVAIPGIVNFGTATLDGSGNASLSGGFPLTTSPGAYPMVANYSGDSVYPPIQNQQIGTITVTAPLAQATLAATFTPASVPAGGSVSISIAVTGNE